MLARYSAYRWRFVATILYLGKVIPSTSASLPPRRSTSCSLNYLGKIRRNYMFGVRTRGRGQRAFWNKPISFAGKLFVLTIADRTGNALESGVGLLYRMIGGIVLHWLGMVLFLLGLENRSGNAQSWYAGLNRVLR
ncbi:MAG: hypothetical protein R2932_40560 [Caldilineaceae bacterium]